MRVFMVGFNGSKTIQGLFYRHEPINAQRIVSFQFNIDSAWDEQDSFYSVKRGYASVPYDLI
jgi:hypothetical protein